MVYKGWSCWVGEVLGEVTGELCNKVFCHLDLAFVLVLGFV